MYQLSVCLFLTLFSCTAGREQGVDQVKEESKQKEIKISNGMEKATFGAGCFWCVEAIFSELKGVESVEPGYAGGQTDNPTYKEICIGTTGHAEVAQITFDPSVISFAKLLSVFWKTHDPTTLNRQGADSGTQYRSVVFYHTEEQKQTAEKYKKELSESGAWDNPIVTEISALDKFYPAENYHQDYYANNKDQQYCRYVIQPKLEKFRAVFAEELKD
ncbi:MAG: peptide-methionine (S)-S-oxide reductase MsrA [Flavobacteriales bacterium]|nr:peptide-methionine (S)-S-oxide reductase MsrA [Flavobacteriales bacterium]